MSTKTERITILGTPEFKAFLSKEASSEGVSVSELVRSRCLGTTSSEDEQLLAELIDEVNLSTKKAKESLDKGVRDAEAVLAKLRGRRA